MKEETRRAGRGSLGGLHDIVRALQSSRRFLDVLEMTGEQARTRIGEVEQAYLTSAGGDVAAGEADLHQQHPEQA